MAKTLILALLAFNMPAFHLVYIENGQAVENLEDLTLTECRKRANHYRQRAQAQCVLAIGEREYT